MVGRPNSSILFFLHFLCGPLLLIAVTPLARAEAPPTDVVDQLLHLNAPAPTGSPQTRPSIPDQNASADALVDYWIDGPFDGFLSPNQHNHPSDAIRKKLLIGGLKDPVFLPALLRYIPTSPAAADAVKQLYDKRSALPQTTEDWKTDVRQWLTFNTRYFRDDLLAAAGHVKLDAISGSQDNVDALRALAKLDWPTAYSLLIGYEKSNKAEIATIAKVIRFEHAIEVNDIPARNAAGGRLEQIARDVALPSGARERAVAALFSAHWANCDGILAALLPEVVTWSSEPDRIFARGDDPAFGQDIVGRVMAEPDHYIPILRKALDSPDRKTQWSAVRGLMLVPRAETLRLVIPLLLQKENLDADDATALAKAAAAVDLPESLPLLHKIMVDDKAKAIWVARAMVRQNSPDANEALRKCVQSGTGLFRNIETEEALRMLVERGAIPIKQVADEIEAFATRSVNEDANGGLFGGSLFGGQPKITDHGQDFTTAAAGKAGLADVLLDRAAALRAAKPTVADEIWTLLTPWPDPAIDRRLMGRLRDEPIGLPLALLAKDRAALLRQNQSAALRQLQASGGLRAGIAGAILGDAPTVGPILKGNDVDAICMLLATGRLLRTPLPLELVPHLFSRKNPAISTAAEQFLIVDDSPDARRMVLARHPNQAMVLGAGIWNFSGEDNADHDDDDPARAEVLKQNGAEEIFQLYAPWNNMKITARRDSATLDVEPNPGKHLRRDLTADELKSLRAFMAANKVDDLPELVVPIVDGALYEFYHITRAGGRRIFMGNPGEMGTANTPHFHLIKLFERLESHGNFTTHYDLQDVVPGVDVVLASNPAQHIHAVWKQGDDLRVFVGPTEDSAWENTDPVVGDWHAVRDGKIAEPVATPPGGAFHTSQYADAALERNIYDGGQSAWRYGLVGDTAIHAGEDHEASAGIWRIRPGKRPQRIIAGPYANPVVTPDGKWAIVENAGIFRLDLSNGKLFPIDLPGGKEWSAVCFVPGRNAILLAGHVKGASAKQAAATADYLLVDPATAATKAVHGDLQPLLDNGNRPLLPSPNADQFWMACYLDAANETDLILYDVRSFKRIREIALPKVKFTSDVMTVDVAENAAYVAVDGDLLRIALPK
ncbi:MAG TPA: hypothetical protein VFE47_22065 [Tepidisphaeraceae bacterium]|jgi:hypothetical protein|nr:hypothetical protein [Tepidisphaeraceae bacterium]